MNPTISQIPFRRIQRLRIQRKIRGVVCGLQAVTAIVLGSSGQAEPALVYDNGPVLGPDSWNIGPYGDSDSFTVSCPTILTSVRAGLGVAGVGIPASVQWRIGTAPGGAEISAGFAHFASTYSASVYDSTFEINANLASAGTYYLTLFSALTSVGGGD